MGECGNCVNGYDRASYIRGAANSHESSAIFTQKIVKMLKVNNTVS